MGSCYGCVLAQEEIKPNVDEWIKTGYPKSLHVKAYNAGIQVEATHFPFRIPPAC